MCALICYIREMVRIALVQFDPVYINFNMLHNGWPDRTGIVSFVQINVGFLTLLSMTIRYRTLSHRLYSLTYPGKNQATCTHLLALVLGSQWFSSSAVWGVQSSWMDWTLWRNPSHCNSSLLEFTLSLLFSSVFCMCSNLHFTVKVTAFFLWGLQGKQPFVSICEHTCSLCLGRVPGASKVIIFL